MALDLFNNTGKIPCTKVQGIFPERERLFFEGSLVNYTISVKSGGRIVYGSC